MFLFSILLFGSLVGIDGANIVFFNGLSSPSHLIAFEPLIHKLANEGHHVTVLSPTEFKNGHPNMTYFCPQSYRAKQNELNFMGEYALQIRSKSKYADFWMQGTGSQDGAVDMCRVLYTSPDFRQWISTSKIDLFIIDNFQRECAIPVAYMLGAKFIIFHPTAIWYGDPDTFGFGTEPWANIPFATEHPYLPDSILFEFRTVSWFIWRQWSFLPKYDLLIKQELIQNPIKNSQGVSVLDPNVPPLAEMERQAGLYLLNQHFSMEYSRSLPPYVIPVGGMHCKESKGISGPESAEIKRTIDDPNSDGFIYISFGTNVKVSGLSKEQLAAFFDAINLFPTIKFLWKWEDQFPDNLPSNLFMSHWFSQQDILAHSKCKGFISQAGTMSFQQSIFHAVPLIVMPSGGDQIYNGRWVERLGVGILVEFSELTLESLAWAIGEILTNTNYTEKVKETSRQFKDRPTQPVDLAYYWVTYILRHDESTLAKLKPPGMFQSWWERRQLFPWFLFFAALQLISLVLFAVIVLIVGSLVSRGRVSPKNGVKLKKNK